MPLLALADELLEIITKALPPTGKGGRASLTATCHRFRRIAIPHLWHCIKDEGMSDDTFLKLLRTLDEDPDLPPYVHALELNSSERPQFVPLKWSERNWFARCRLVYLCPALRSLTVNHDEPSLAAWLSPDLADIVNHRLPRLFDASRLTTLRLGHSETSPLQLRKILCASNVVDLTYAPNFAVEYTDIEKALEPVASTLRRLALGTCLVLIRNKLMHRKLPEPRLHLSALEVLRIPCDTVAFLDQSLARLPLSSLEKLILYRYTERLDLPSLFDSMRGLRGVRWFLAGEALHKPKGQPVWVKQQEPPWRVATPRLKEIMLDTPAGWGWKEKPAEDPANRDALRRICEQQGLLMGDLAEYTVFDQWYSEEGDWLGVDSQDENEESSTDDEGSSLDGESSSGDKGGEAH